MIFLRISRHDFSASARVAAIEAFGSSVTLLTVDVGAFTDNASEQIRAAVAQAGAHAVEVVAPGHVLDALGDVGAPRYRAIMARGEDGRVVVERDENGPMRDSTGRDVLRVAGYELVRAAVRPALAAWAPGAGSLGEALSHAEGALYALRDEYRALEARMARTEELLARTGEAWRARLNKTEAAWQADLDASRDLLDRARRGDIAW